MYVGTSSTSPVCIGVSFTLSFATGSASLASLRIAWWKTLDLSFGCASVVFDGLWPLLLPLTWMSNVTAAPPGVGIFTAEPVCVREDNWHNENHYPISSASAFVASGGGVHPFCLKRIRTFAITPPKSLLPHLGWGPSELGLSRCVSRLCLSPAAEPRQSWFSAQLLDFVSLWIHSSLPALFTAP